VVRKGFALTEIFVAVIVIVVVLLSGAYLLSQNYPRTQIPTTSSTPSPTPAPAASTSTPVVLQPDATTTLTPNPIGPMQTTGIVPAFGAEYPIVLNGVKEKCGTAVELLGLLIHPGYSLYAFTHGTCGSGSSSEIVVIRFDFSNQSVGNVTIHNMQYSSYDYDFGHAYASPISLSNWKISSKEALQIFSKHDGPADISASRLVGLLLRQTGNSLTWKCIYDNGVSNYVGSLDATTGQFLGSRSYNWSDLKM
jgi:hypothetical protein